ncbi:hypothetical protein AURANDRAFT_71751, partial [Aureococcus anophagefferens]
RYHRLGARERPNASRAAAARRARRGAGPGGVRGALRELLRPSAGAAAVDVRQGVVDRRGDVRGRGRRRHGARRLRVRRRAGELHDARPERGAARGHARRGRGDHAQAERHGGVVLPRNVPGPRLGHVLPHAQPRGRRVLRRLPALAERAHGRAEPHALLRVRVPGEPGRALHAPRVRAAARRRDRRGLRGGVLRALHVHVPRAHDGRRPLPALRLRLALRAGLPRALGRPRLLRRRRPVSRRRRRARARRGRGPRARRPLAGPARRRGAPRRRGVGGHGGPRRENSPRRRGLVPGQREPRARLRRRPLRPDQGPPRGRGRRAL